MHPFRGLENGVADIFSHHIISHSIESSVNVAHELANEVRDPIGLAHGQALLKPDPGICCIACRPQMAGIYIFLPHIFGKAFIPRVSSFRSEIDDESFWTLLSVQPSEISLQLSGLISRKGLVLNDEFQVWSGDEYVEPSLIGMNLRIDGQSTPIIRPRRESNRFKKKIEKPVALGMGGLGVQKPSQNPG